MYQRINQLQFLLKKLGRWLRQKDLLSTTIFNLEAIIRNYKLKTEPQYKTTNTNVCMSFADDLAILITNQNELKRIIRVIEKSHIKLCYPEVTIDEKRHRQ